MTVTTTRGTAVGWLADGTAYYAPLGRMPADGDRVGCHLCGSWFLSVASHLPVHGWTKAAYIAAFGLELSNPLAGEATHKRRSAALTARQAVEPVVQRAQAEARTRARSGALTLAASLAARGRPHPAERRAKTLAALSRISRTARADGSRRHVRHRLDQIAAEVAARFGFADLASYVLDRLGRGMSLAAISREAGLHRDWLSRQLPTLAPQVARVRHSVRPHSGDVRLTPAAHRLGFPDVETYLRTEHIERHRTVATLAAETGVTRSTILAALRRHRIEPVPHTAKRHESAQHDRAAAQILGFVSLTAYVTERRAHGATWKNIAAESGVAETTLRRRAGRQP